MNNEQQHIIDEAYENYVKQFSTFESGIVKSIAGNNPMVDLLLNNNSSILSQEEFIHKCKTDTEFSEKWGLKIEERELSLEERLLWSLQNVDSFVIATTTEELNEWNVPTKLITVTYNNETIEIYE